MGLQTVCNRLLRAISSLFFQQTQWMFAVQWVRCLFASVRKLILPRHKAKQQLVNEQKEKLVKTNEKISSHLLNTYKYSMLCGSMTKFARCYIWNGQILNVEREGQISRLLAVGYRLLYTLILRCSVPQTLCLVWWVKRYGIVGTRSHHFT